MVGFVATERAVVREDDEDGANAEVVESKSKTAD